MGTYIAVVGTGGTVVGGTVVGGRVVGGTVVGGTVVVGRVVVVATDEVECDATEDGPEHPAARIAPEITTGMRHRRMEPP